MLYEVEMSGKTYYTKAKSGLKAAKKIQKKFGNHYSHAFFTGRIKENGKDDVK